MGPISPSPSTAVPSVTTAIILPRAVNEFTFDSSSVIALHTSDTPGVYTTLKSCSSLTSTLLVISIFPERSWCKLIESVVSFLTDIFITPYIVL